MTQNPISDSTIFHFCRFFTLNALANLTFSKEVNEFYRKITLCCSLSIDYFWNWSAHASNHGNHFKASGQVSFKYLYTLLSNKGHHIPSNFWICCCRRNKLCHIMVIFVMFKETKSAATNIFRIFFIFFLNHL